MKEEERQFLLDSIKIGEWYTPISFPNVNVVERILYIDKKDQVHRRAAQTYPQIYQFVFYEDHTIPLEEWVGKTGMRNSAPEDFRKIVRTLFDCTVFKWFKRGED
jgi:hypothetical protein